MTAKGTFVAKFVDLELVSPDVDEETIAPTEIMALVMANPVPMEQHLEFDRVVPLDKPLNMDLLPHRVGLMNKVTPEMLLAVVANLIATSPNARVAVARLRNEVMGWQFQRADGTIE